jgi:hypothetical protein
MSRAVEAWKRTLVRVVAAPAVLAVLASPLAPSAAGHRRRPPVGRIGIQIQPQTITVGGATTASGRLQGGSPGGKPLIYIQRQSVNTKRFRTVSRTVLVDAAPDHSDFRKKVRIIRSAIYAVRVRATTFNAQGFSPPLPLPLRVH